MTSFNHLGFKILAGTSAVITALSTAEIARHTAVLMNAMGLQQQEARRAAQRQADLEQTANESSKARKTWLW
jgi:hypothetical protein